MRFCQLYIVSPIPPEIIFSYNDTVNNINTDDTSTYNCANSEHSNQHHGHIITGNLRIIENKKLHQIISNDPNYTKPKTMNWGKK